MEKEWYEKGWVWAVVVLCTLGLIIIAMVGLPKYRIYRQDLRGQATLREQEWSKKVLVEQARAERDSAILEAEAEIERAKGVAEANKIIGGSLKGNEAYLKYLMIQTLEDQETSLIYVPTEAGLPVLEANRFNQ